MTRKRQKGFRAASALLRNDIRKVGESRGFAVTKVLTHWTEIVGEDTAGICKPVDVKYGRQGLGATLTLLTTGPQAPMLEMQKETIRERVNAAYGYNAISRLRITQTSPTGFAEGQAQFRAAPKRKPTPAPEAIARAKSAAEPVQDPGLRAALERLGSNVIEKQAQRKKP